MRIVAHGQLIFVFYTSAAGLEKASRLCCWHDFESGVSKQLVEDESFKLYFVSLLDNSKYTTNDPGKLPSRL